MADFRTDLDFAGFYQTGLTHYSTCMAYPVPLHTGSTLYPQSKPESKADRGKALKKKLKAESKACQLMTSLIGAEQGAIYKKTKRVITKPNKYFWVIGDIFQGRYTVDPFWSNPDVIRIDDEKKLYYTKFCVIQLGPQTPYTDKVISFLTNLNLDEKIFKKTINRITEGRFNKIAECALWES